MVTRLRVTWPYYPQPAGSPELREYVAWKLEYDRGFKVGIDDILLTAGSGESIGLAIQALTNPGDTAITEHFVYSGTLGQLQRFGNTVYGAETDDEGLVPEAVDELIKKLDAKGKKPKMIYTIAEHQKPDGPHVAGRASRSSLGDCASPWRADPRRRVLRDLRFEGEMQPAFRTLDDSGIVIHVASFSKLLAPGLRMGYITAAPEVLRRSMSCKVGSGPISSPATPSKAFA